MLAAKVDFERKRATIGIEKGGEVPKAEILRALESLNYQGMFVDIPPHTTE